MNGFLFDMTPDNQRKVEPAKSQSIARSSDPSTSHEAARMFDRVSAKQALKNGFEFYAPQDCTVQEAATVGMERRQSVESVRKRYTDLLSEEWIEEVSKRNCRITGKPATTYRKKEV